MTSDSTAFQGGGQSPLGKIPNHATHLWSRVSALMFGQRNVSVLATNGTPAGADQRATPVLRTAFRHAFNGDRSGVSAVSAGGAVFLDAQQVRPDMFVQHSGASSILCMCLWRVLTLARSLMRFVSCMEGYGHEQGEGRLKPGDDTIEA